MFSTHLRTYAKILQNNALVRERPLFLGAALALSLCPTPGCADLDDPSAESVGEEEQHLFGKSHGYWPTSESGLTTIHVCWEFDGYETDKGYVQSAVEGQWGAVSGVRFVGWDRCGDSTPQRAIRIRQEDTTPHVDWVGYSWLSGARMTLNFTYSAWNPRTDQGCECPWYDPHCWEHPASAYGIGCDTCADQHDSCNAIIGLHEFGHALGFFHEMQRPGNEHGEFCDEYQEGQENNPPGGELLTPEYDTASIMSYCTPWDHESPSISRGDEEGIREAYGTKPSTLTGQVILYEDAAYGRSSQALYPGVYDLGSLAVGNDALSSLRIPNGWSVRLYEHSGQGGAYVDLAVDVVDLRGIGWNDRASSLLVRGPQSSYPVIYADVQYTGASQVLRPGVYHLRDLGIGNDTLSSLKVPFGWRVTLYEHSGFEGESVVHRYDAPSVGSFNDRTSSIRVTGPSGSNPALIFSGNNATGSGQALWPGRYDVDDLTIGNDTLSSLVLQPGWSATLIDNSGFWGATRKVTWSHDALAYIGFNDQTSSLVVEGPAPGEEVNVSTGRVSFTPTHSGMSLDVFGGSTSDGAALVQWPWGGGDNQRFQAVDTGDGHVRLVARHSGKCLSVKDARLDDRAPVVQWACNGADDQRFRFEDAGGGYARIVAKHSGKCLDIEWASTAAGAAVIQWPCTGGDNQRFTLSPQP